MNKYDFFMLNMKNNVFAKMKSWLSITTTLLIIDWWKENLFWDDFPIEEIEKRFKLNLIKFSWTSVIQIEIVLVTSKSWKNLTIERAIELCPLNGNATEHTQTAYEFDEWDYIYFNLTAWGIKELEEAIKNSTDFVNYLKAWELLLNQWVDIFSIKKDTDGDGDSDENELAKLNLWGYQLNWTDLFDSNGKLKANFLESSWTVIYKAQEVISKWDKINADIQNNGRIIYLWWELPVVKATGNLSLWIAKADYAIWDTVETMNEQEWQDYLTWDESDGDLITSAWDNIVLETNRIYNYKDVNIANGSTITTNATTGFIFLKVKWTLNIEWNFNLSSKIEVFETYQTWIWTLNINPWNPWTAGSGWYGGNGWYHSSYWSAWTRGIWGSGINWFGWWGGGWWHGSWQNGTVRTSWNGWNGWTPAWLGWWWTISGWNSAWGWWAYKFWWGMVWANAYSNSANYAWYSWSWGWWWAWWKVWSFWVCLVIIHQNTITGVWTIQSNGWNGTNGGNGANGWSYSWGSGTNVSYSSWGWWGGWGWAWWWGGGWSILLVWPTTSLTLSTTLNGWNPWTPWNWWSGWTPYNFNGQQSGSAWNPWNNGWIGGTGNITYKPLSEVLDLYKPTY